MHYEVFKGTSDTIVLGDQIRRGRDYAIGVANCDVSFNLEMALPDLGWVPTDWKGGQEPDASKIITTVFPALCTGIRIKMESAPAGEVIVILQERSVSTP